MPTIAAYPDPARTYVRVETNWADVPSAEFVGVDRVDAATGASTPLRPYVCFDGWCLRTSCGEALFWDTEVPLDRPVFYRAHACPSVFTAAECAVLDTFTRTVANGWGSADVGGAWTTSGGAAANYSVDGARGVITIPTGDLNSRNLTLAGVYAPVDVRCTIRSAAVATGSTINGYLMVRYTDGANHYRLRLAFTTSSVIDLFLQKVAGATTTLATANAVMAYSAGADVRARIRMVGGLLQGKIWPAGTAEPAAWQVTATDTTFASGQIGVRADLGTGNTNINPQVLFDDLTVCNPCDDPVELTVETSQLTVASAGMFRLKDPVRPCHDIAVPLCAALDGTACEQDGVSFDEMDVEQFAANSFSLPLTNRSRPISISRPRRGVSSNLHLISHTFTDRDALQTLLAPGSLLLWQGPPEYGIPDRYMDVGQVSVARGLKDHRKQARKMSLPHTENDRPAGPTQGVCGNRVADLCDVYPTWAAMDAAGLTWLSLLQGAASTPDPTDGLRTWGDVAADFADWDAVDDGVRTWQGLLEGD